MINVDMKDSILLGLYLIIRVTDIMTIGTES